MKPEAVHPVRVSSYSGYKGEERPVAFDHSGRTLRIVEITDRWVGEGVVGSGAKWYFRVKADDGHLYLLFYDPSLEGWFLEQGPSLQPP